MEFTNFLKENNFSVTWTNELGSIMTVSYGQDGSLSGTYQSAVGTGFENFELSGRWDTRASQDFSYAVGWSVVWTNKKHRVDRDRVTSWSGHHVIDNGSFVIKSTWLLTRDEVIKENWKSTLVGQDTFTLS